MCVVGKSFQEFFFFLINGERERLSFGTVHACVHGKERFCIEWSDEG